MLSSVDGRIDGKALGAVMGEGEYEAAGAKLEGDAWIGGRTSSSILDQKALLGPPACLD
jgi:hypothetical protein